MEDADLVQRFSELRTEMRQIGQAVTDLRTVLLGSAGTGVGAGQRTDADIRRVLLEGAKAFSTGMSTSPYRENSDDEQWWRLGWQIAKDAVKANRGGW